MLLSAVFCILSSFPLPSNPGSVAIDIPANLEQHTPIGASTAFRYGAKS
jgi:hypothetical protein